MADSPAAGTRPTLFVRLLAESREAHAGGQHEVAYHALMAAMHAADDVADLRALEAVSLEAAAQLQHIDRHLPQHRLSTSSASRHVHPGVFTLLARQSTMLAHLHESRRHSSEPRSGGAK
jgi:hypothetical protein